MLEPPAGSDTGPTGPGSPPEATLCLSPTGEPSRGIRVVSFPD